MNTLDKKIDDEERKLTCADCKHFYEKFSCAENPGIEADTEACGDIERFKCNDDRAIEEFNRKVWEVMRNIAFRLMSKNEKYHGAYRKVRQLCKIKYGDPTIPYTIHIFEKRLRQGDSILDLSVDETGRLQLDAMNETDDEDARFDELGYRILEIVCSELDDYPDTCR